MKDQWQQELTNTFGKASPAPMGTVSEWAAEGGAIDGDQLEPSGQALVEYDGEQFTLTDGDVVIAAITSCTNTSNPDVMVGAGLVARKARALGLNRKPWVKTSLAPGSQVVTEYLESAGLMDDLEATGFYLVGYGCTTCIGNSGPLPDQISAGINEHEPGGCRRCSPGTATSKAASRPTSRPTTWPRRRLSSPTPGRDRELGPDQRADRAGPRRQRRVPRRHLADPGGDR